MTQGLQFTDGGFMGSSISTDSTRYHTNALTLGLKINNGTTGSSVAEFITNQSNSGMRSHAFRLNLNRAF